MGLHGVAAENDRCSYMTMMQDDAQCAGQLARSWESKDHAFKIIYKAAETGFNDAQKIQVATY